MNYAKVRANLDAMRKEVKASSLEAQIIDYMLEIVTEMEDLSAALDEMRKMVGLDDGN